MWISVYEVVICDHIGSSQSFGLYFMRRSAIRAAKSIAQANGWTKTKIKHTWGEADDYGLIRGVYITTRKVEE